MSEGVLPTTAANLTPRELRVVHASLSGKKVAEIAKAEGISPRTVRRILARPHVKRARRVASRELHRATMDQLQAAGQDALQGLRRVISDKSARPSDVVSASRAILDFGIRAAEQIDLQDRIEDLESLRSMR